MTYLLSLATYAGGFRHSIRHRFGMAEGRIVENENLRGLAPDQRQHGALEFEHAAARQRDVAGDRRGAAAS
jgi:hypothetical protein